MRLLPGKKRAEVKQRRVKDDWYTENRWAVEQLFGQMRFTGPIHDPACGKRGASSLPPNAPATKLPAVISSTADSAKPASTFSRTTVRARPSSSTRRTSKTKSLLRMRWRLPRTLSWRSYASPSCVVRSGFGSSTSLARPRWCSPARNVSTCRRAASAHPRKAAQPSRRQF